MARVVTFGELMLKLSPEGYLRFTQAGRYTASYGGSEANVAVSLAAYGDSAAFVSKLPEHDIGSNGVSALRARKPPRFASSSTIRWSWIACAPSASGTRWV